MTREAKKRSLAYVRQDANVATGELPQSLSRAGICLFSAEDDEQTVAQDFCGWRLAIIVWLGAEGCFGRIVRKRHIGMQIFSAGDLRTGLADPPADLLHSGIDFDEMNRGQVFRQTVLVHSPTNTELTPIGFIRMIIGIPVVVAVENK